MHWSVVKFGKHCGKTLPEIIFHDPGYFFWAIEAEVFRGALKGEAKCIDERARRIRVPSGVAGKPKVGYVYSRFDGRFSHLKLVPPDSLFDDGDSLLLRRDVIDLSLVFSVRPNFKVNGEALIASFKSIIFADAGYRMTRQRCQAFFSRDENFLI